MFCVNCGKENRDGAVYCCGCGKSVKVMDYSKNSEAKTTQVRSKKVKKEKKKRIAWKDKPFMIVPMVLSVLAILVMFLPYCETVEATHSFMEVIESIKPSLGINDIEFKEGSSVMYAMIVIVISIVSLLLYVAKINMLGAIVSFVNVAALAFLYYSAISEGLEDYNALYRPIIGKNYAEPKFGVTALIIIAVLLVIGTIGNYIAIRMMATRNNKSE